MLTADPALARDRVTTPQGAQLELRNEPPDALPPIPLPDGWIQSIRYQIETQGEFYWLGFILDHGDGPLVWPRGQHIWLVFADSSVVQDTVIMVSEPMQTMPMLMRKTFLGKGADIPADELWRKPCPWKGTCTNVLVAFPRARLPKGYGISKVVDVRVGPVPRSNAPHLGERSNK